MTRTRGDVNTHTHERNAVDSSPTDRAEIRAHIERHIGRIAAVYPERRREQGPGSEPGRGDIEIMHVEPVEALPYHTLITAGMSELRMDVPAEVEAPRRLELMMTLPERWPLDARSREQPRYGWPISLLQELARYPSRRGTWLGWGHTVPNGDPPRAYARTVGSIARRWLRSAEFCGVIIAPSLLVPVPFYELGSGPERIGFLSAIPLYREELELQRRAGMEELLSRLLRHDVSDLVLPERRNVARRFFGLL